MRRRCDRCGKRTWLGIRVLGDWRTFCGWCFLAAAHEPPQPIRRESHSHPVTRP